MKTFYTFLLLFAVIATSYSQKCGNYRINLQGSYNPDSPRYNVWTGDPQFGTAIFEFSESPEGLQNMEDKVAEIFRANGYNNVPAGNNKSKMGNDLTDAYNKSQLHRSIQNDNSELNMEWIMGNQTLIATAFSDGYQITVFNIYN